MIYDLQIIGHGCRSGRDNGDRSHLIETEVKDYLRETACSQTSFLVVDSQHFGVLTNYH